MVYRAKFTTIDSFIQTILQLLYDFLITYLCGMPFLYCDNTLWPHETLYQ